MKPLFLLRHFNDIDHIAPVIWRCLERGDDVTAVLLDLSYDPDSDPRLNFLRTEDNFDLVPIDEFLAIPFARSLFTLDGGQPTGRISRLLKRLLRKTNASNRWAVPALSDVGPDVVVFEWGPPSRLSHVDMFTAAAELDIPRVCFPHGLNIYLNIDTNPARSEMIEQKPMATRNAYDAYVVQSQYHKEQYVELGLESERCCVLGSARYYPEWQQRNASLYDSFVPEHRVDGVLRTVFMVPHWEYYVDKERTLDLLARIAEQDWISLVIKDHTRGDGLPTDFHDRLRRTDTVERTTRTPSVPLIEWADAVVNFGSSIGIEALLQETSLVNPHYLHDNRTIFDETGAAINTSDNDNTLEALQRCYDGGGDLVPDDRKEELYREVVYGGQDEFDVLEAHRELLREQATSS